MNNTGWKQRRETEAKGAASETRECLRATKEKERSEAAGDEWKEGGGRRGEEAEHGWGVGRGEERPVRRQVKVPYR